MESYPPTGHFFVDLQIYPQFTLLFSVEILLIFRGAGVGVEICRDLSDCVDWLWYYCV